MSFDYMYDAKAILTKEGYPFFVIQFPPERTRYLWDMQGDGAQPISAAKAVYELRALASRIEQSQH